MIKKYSFLKEKYIKNIIKDLIKIILVEKNKNKKIKNDLFRNKRF